MFTIKMADHYRNHRCLVEKKVPIALILPSRWQDGAESLVELTSVDGTPHFIQVDVTVELNDFRLSVPY